MLAIRLQRTGRRGHAQYRMIVQDSRFSPTRGRVVSYLGSYDPHTKAVAIDGQKAAKYLENGAQPSDRVARLLQKEGIKLPSWVKLNEPRERATRNPDKRRSTRPEGPAQPAEPATAEAPAETQTPAEAEAAEVAAETTAAVPAKEPEKPVESQDEPAPAIEPAEESAEPTGEAPAEPEKA